MTKATHSLASYIAKCKVTKNVTYQLLVRPLKFSDVKNLSPALRNADITYIIQVSVIIG